MKFPFRITFWLWIQLAVAKIFAIPTYYFFVFLITQLKGYRSPHRERIRKEFLEFIAQNPKAPILICANHLTLIDSLLIMWTLTSGYHFMTVSKMFPWNIPEERNFYKNLLLRLMCYFGKCIPVRRKGPPHVLIRTMQSIHYVLSLGESVMIFPEGGRGRKDRIDENTASQGVGRIYQMREGTRVLGVYFRGRGQTGYTNLPQQGEEFYVALKEIFPKTDQVGNLGAKEISAQILHGLKEMENRYFEEVGNKPQDSVGAQH